MHLLTVLTPYILTVNLFFFSLCSSELGMLTLGQLSLRSIVCVFLTRTLLQVLQSEDIFNSIDPRYAASLEKM